MGMTMGCGLLGCGHRTWWLSLPNLGPLPQSSLCLMSRNHSSARTVAEWVTWAQSEGFNDIAEKNAQGGETAGKVYCVLCAKSIAASASAIKQHCVGYFDGKEENRKFHESAHAIKAAKRDRRVAAEVAAQPHAPPSIAPHTIIVQVTFFLFSKRNFSFF